MTANNKKGKNRYQSLIIFISLFVLIIVGVLTINFYFSAQFSDDATEINLAGRQRMLSQRIAKSIQKLIQAQSTNQDIDESFQELKKVFNLFDKTLKAFTDGGETIGASNDVVNLKQVSISDAKTAVTNANEIWKDYSKALNELSNIDMSPLHLLASSIEYAKDNNKQLLSLMDQLTRSLQVKKYEGIYVNLAGRQRMLSQRITKSLFELVNAQYSNTQSTELLNSLKADIQAFDLTLNLFLNGGEYQFDLDENIQIVAVKDSDTVSLINQGIKLWKPLAQSVIKLLEGNNGVFEKISIANKFSNQYNLQLLTYMNDLTVALDKDSSNRSSQLRYIQIFGIALALLMFSFIMLFFIKHLKHADSELDQAKEETDRILETVNDGLFLIDEDHIIGEQHSDSLLAIMNIEEPAGKDFLSILRKIVPKNTLNTANEYLSLLYGDRVNEDLVQDLNPLDEVEVYFDQEGPNKSVGYLGFEFKRVIRNNEISHLLVQVEDITQRIKLEKQLAESKTEAQAQFNLMIQVLHVQPEMLGQFLSDTEKSLKRINKVLQGKNKGKNSHHNKLKSISRYMHRIKGDASSLELQGFEQQAHDFEDLFEEMKNIDDLSGKDFLPVVIKLDEFISQIESLRLLIAKLSDLQKSLKSSHSSGVIETTETSNNNMSQKLHNLTNSLATKHGKSVILNIFNEHLLSENLCKPVSDILTQLIRNSVVHGIEIPKYRLHYEKANEGLIRIKFSIDLMNNLLIDYTDDGKGLIRQDIIDSAIEKGVLNKQDSVFLNREKIYSLIFKSGFSIKKDIDNDAGRGVGMDVIADIVKKSHGKIGIKSVENKYFRMQLKLPLKINKVV